MAEGRAAPGADPLAAAVVALGLLRQGLEVPAQQLVAAEQLERGALLVGELLGSSSDPRATAAARREPRAPPRRRGRRSRRRGRRRRSRSRSSPGTSGEVVEAHQDELCWPFARAVISIIHSWMATGTPSLRAARRRIRGTSRLPERRRARYWLYFGPRSLHSFGSLPPPSA